VTVRVVLDTSALLAYARLDGLAVGELIIMVEEDGGSAVVGIPAGCFLAAYPALDTSERSRLVDLATKTDGVTTVLPLLGADAVQVAEMDSRLGEPGAAHAVVETRRHGCLVATYSGISLGKELPAESILDL
jgi:PIN domain nuclease of toxin-antitoxin system